ncbi:MAG: class I adenylate-forming enzyme family protein [Candidatus Nitrosopumilus sp. bin_32a]
MVVYTLQNIDLTDTLDENKIGNLENIQKLFRDVFEQKWNEDFIYDAINQRTVKYSEFFSEVISCQKELKSKDLKSGNIICTLLDNSIEFVKIYFVALFSNITIVPIDPEKGRSEIKEIINDVKPKLVIYDNFDCEFLGEKIQINEINQQVFQESKDNLILINNLDIEQDFLITFTSGSTGKPKGVVHSLKNLILSALSFNEKFNFNSKNIFLHNLPMSYMAGILNLIFLPFISESKIVIDHRFSLKSAMDFWKIPEEFSVNTFWFTPTIIGLLLKFDRSNKGVEFAQNKSIIGCVGTSPLNPTIKDEFENKYKIKLYESYGLSETLFVTTNSPNLKNHGVGKLLKNTKIDLKEKEIRIKVPWMFKRYHDSQINEDLTDGYFLSGDLGEILEENILVISGRKKDLIIKGGINLSPKKLEDFIIDRKIFQECVVLGFPDKVLGEKTVCFIISVENNDDLKKQLNKKIIDELGKDYHIDEFIELVEIPKTVNGKINKPQIRELYHKRDK